MSAGTGVRHSEFNASSSELVHFLQLWILPDRVDHNPGYEERNFGTDRQNALRLLVSGNPQADALHINADVQLFGSELEAGKILTHVIPADRYGWIQVVSGKLVVESGNLSHTLNNGDGLGVSMVSDLRFQALSDCEFLVFDLP